MNYLSSRIESIDVLRGLVLILMLLDHTRGFFSDISIPLSLTDSTPLVYFTRWITHYCAPVFIFLAGVSAYLYQQRGRHSNQRTASFLLTRGLWFMVLEGTLLFAVWTFFLIPYQWQFEVFAAIGFSMICLSGLIFLPLWLIGVISVVLIVGHNFLDTLSPDSFGGWSWLWIILHEGGKFNIGGWLKVQVLYPVIPWIGVIGLGYCMGQLFTLPETVRRKWFLVLGSLLVIAFLVLRFMNAYGDFYPWSEQDTMLLTVMSFLNTTKYPPSLSFLLMTLGPAFIFFGVITEKSCTHKIGQFLTTFGSVPLFFYIIHLILALSCALLVVYVVHGASAISFYYTNSAQYGYPILTVYFVAACFLFLLYYPCSWYKHIKATHKKWYLKYF